MPRSLTLPLLPIVAAGAFALASYLVWASQPVRPQATPLAAPPKTPFAHTVAAVGLIEPASELVAISTPVPGLVATVYVAAGQEVPDGAPLFRLDDRDLVALRAVRARELATAEHELARLAQAPRREDIPPLEARVAAAQAALDDARVQQQLIEEVDDPRAIRREDLLRRRIATRAATAQLAAARADLARVTAGTWAAELAVARARRDLAASAVAQIDTDLARLTVTAPRAGRVLKVNVRAGEYAPSGILQAPLIVFGDVSTLHVRADVDEQEASLVTAGAEAYASPRGRADERVPLAFVRIEPYVVPKRQLTGDVVERVDTRVLQVIYRVDARAVPLYVGQQMDVFIARATPALAAHALSR